LGLRKKKLRSAVPNATARRLPRTGHASESGGVSHGLQLGERERRRLKMIERWRLKAMSQP